jgi:ribosome-binding factor A
MAKKTFTKTKLEERIMNEINSSLRAIVNDPSLQFVSVTKVILNGDFSEAVCSWDTFDNSRRGDAKKAISKVASRLRGILSQKLELRHTPKLNFTYDDSFECEKNITELLSENQK